MKRTPIIALCILLISFLSSCSSFDLEKEKLGGEESPMAEKGVTVSSTSINVAGVSDFSGTITSSENGIATYEGKAVVTNSYLKQLFANIPEVTVVGDTIKTEDFQMKQTKDGLELLSGPTSGILVNYSSSVGDKYQTDDPGIEREVVSKSTTDDYPYGFYNIKVIEVEEPTSVLKSGGVSKITYYANHRFGLVGIQFSFDDGTTAKFPVYTSTENQ